jgi:hypothetical protein
MLDAIVARVILHMRLVESSMTYQPNLVIEGRLKEYVSTSTR